MKILKLPFFILGLIWNNFFNLLHLMFFRAISDRLTMANLLLTATTVGLLISWRLLPYPQPITPPVIALHTETTREITPNYFTWDQEEVQQAYADYLQQIEQQSFLSQADYVNLAVLAHATGEYDQANEYLSLAKQLDPNRDFFWE